MLPSECPFCNPDPERVFLKAELIVGLWDAFPVAAGHALLVTRRHVASWFDATASEQQALSDAIQARVRPLRWIGLATFAGALLVALLVHAPVAVIVPLFVVEALIAATVNVNWPKTQARIRKLETIASPSARKAK